jgi:glycosyltransferase involved in cell wall biosynthesis
LTAIKVAHITTIDLSLRYLLLNQLYSIQQDGYEVYGVSSPGPDVPALEALNIRHIPVPMTRNVTPLADLVSLWRLYWVMRRERFEIVHGHTPKAEFLGQIAARLARTPIVVDTFRGLYVRQDMHPFWRRLFIMMARIAASRADLVLSQSKWAMELAIQERICPPEKIKLLGNGVDLQRFDSNLVKQTSLNRLRVELGLLPDAPVVGFVGRLVREKGVLELLEAAKIVQKQLPSVRFLFIGPLDQEKADALHPDVARDYGLEKSCIFTGLRHDLPELYALMNVFVLPTHRESFPRSPIEASAMGVPCILTDIPGCREVVEHDQNGWLVPLGDVPALAGAIFKLLTDPAQARRLGDAGRQIARERFDERSIFAHIKAEYARLLQAKGLPGASCPA